MHSIMVNSIQNLTEKNLSLFDYDDYTMQRTLFFKKEITMDKKKNAKDKYDIF